MVSPKLRQELGQTIQKCLKDIGYWNAGTIEFLMDEAEAEAMSQDLKKRGFRFVGPTICYAFMQAVGMVNDHSPQCFRA